MGNITSYVYWTQEVPTDNAKIVVENTKENTPENWTIITESDVTNTNTCSINKISQVVIFPTEIFDQIKSGITLKHVDSSSASSNSKKSLFDQIKKGITLKHVEKRVKVSLRDQLLDSIKETFANLNKIDSIEYTKLQKLNHIEIDPRETSKKNAINRMRKNSEELMKRMAVQKIKVENSIYMETIKETSI